MKTTGHIDYIEIPSQDLTVTKQFFGTVFGWEFIDYGNEYTAIKNAGLNGGFYLSDKLANATDGGVLVVLYSSQLEATLQKIKSTGGVVVQDIFSFPGGRRFHFKDPNGNEYAVWSDKP